MATLVSLSADPILRFTDDAGNPLVGGLLYTTVGGEPFQTYSESTGTYANTNPIVLNDRGEIATNVGTSCPLYVVPNTNYTYALQDALGNPIWTATNIVGTMNAAAVLALITPALIGGLIYPQTTTEKTAGITPTNNLYPEGDIRRYGALTTATDNSVAINTALQVSSAGGNAAFIPGGSWAITSTPLAVGSSSMYGAGQNSALIATGCDGLSFLSNQASYEGSRFFRDFSLLGSSNTTSSNNGITINLPTFAKIYGIQFSNLTIENFAKGVYIGSATGLWNSSFIDCFLFNNYQGYYIFGQAVVLNIRGGFVQTGPMTGTGTKYGFFAQDNGGNLQSLHMQGAAFYGYDYLLYLVNPVYVAIENCDLSIYNVCGVYIGGRSGITSIRDCWIQAATVTNCCAIFIQDLNTAQFDRIVIDGNTLLGSVENGTCGIYMGNNAGPVSVTNNEIGNPSAPFAIGIGGNTPAALGTAAVGTDGILSSNSFISNNTINATITAVKIESLASNITVANNIIQSGTPVVFSSTTPPGFVYIAPGMKGTATFPSSTSVTVPLTMPSGDYFVSLGGNASGFVWPVNKTATGFIINCSLTNTHTTDWVITYN